MEWIVVVLAGFLGGMLNAVAGGGSFLTLPALIFVGVPPIAANTTGTAALLPGYIASAWRFRHDIEYPRGLSLLTVSVVALLGGSVGAAMLLLTTNEVFSALIPWLILLSTAAFIIGPKLMSLKKNTTGSRSERHYCRYIQAINITALLVICIYGGYFNGGLGIILLAAFGLMGQVNMYGMNGLKSIVSALLTVIAVIVYAFGGTLQLEYLLVLGVSSVVGGYVGAAFTYRLSQQRLRSIIVFIGVVMCVVFFLRAHID
ncbi:sulfite exporter TauE/SafE family protein [Alkalimarinus alittae]|uniref:sulfite exporter TauE/SafE family protein n=1 Tax=Alkalimarinus alittae TaxID=2961619 RepID=UPI0029FF1724|nr:sulfite exporter TauE/SafE family protein [Alkalimarinus alittae]